MNTSRIVEQPVELLPFLFASQPEVKRTKLRIWLKHGSVQVNGRSVTRSNHPLQIGDVVTLGGKSAARASSLPPGMRIVFEDAALVVIDKPEKLLSIASATERDRTAYAYLFDYVRRGNPRSTARVWIVHRLDRETSGLMVFAKTEAAKRALQEHWHEAEKRYLALVERPPPDDQGVLRSHLNEAGPFKVYSTAPSERTREAVTHYRVLQQHATIALLEITLETGRRNQIRVHLADAKSPVIGDHKYGARTDPARRLGLHASSLQFAHPLTGAVMQFESPLPRELARLLGEGGGRQRG